jgi:hypothetical protein
LAVCRMSASRETLSSTVRKLQRTGPQRGTGRSKELVRRRATSMLGRCTRRLAPLLVCVCERGERSVSREAPETTETLSSLRLEESTEREAQSYKSYYK